MGRGVFLHPTTPFEDGADDDSRYGHRREPDAVSNFGSALATPVAGGGTQYTFTPDAYGGGPFYSASDEPSISGYAGDQVGMDLHFTGQMVDTSRPPDSPNYVIEESQWQVSGNTYF
jgi:hypothetical protein